MESELIENLVNKLMDLKSKIEIYEDRNGELMDEESIFELGKNEMQQIGVLADDKERYDKLVLLEQEIDRMNQSIDDYLKHSEELNEQFKIDVLNIKSNILSIVEMGKDV